MGRKKVEAAVEEKNENKDSLRRVSIRDAQVLSLQEGARVLWRPEGRINYSDPNSDAAVIIG